MESTFEIELTNDKQAVHFEDDYDRREVLIAHLFCLFLGMVIGLAVGILFF